METDARQRCDWSGPLSQQFEGDIDVGRMRVMVNGSLVSYREVISAALKELRPHLEVFTAEPEDLDEEFMRVLPQLVLCSQATDLVRRNAPAWIELYPGHAAEVVVDLGGERVAHPDGLDFESLLSLVDEAERLYQSA